ncbi:MAG: 3-oxoadipate enol-lactonase 2 [Chloroflexi bacterium ADurb.Bin360]|nr:MAG: 3-oxoadipate enol-lactonase 2 [Chloroflexi bacterium ADurb.Bin360]
MPTLEINGTEIFYELHGPEDAPVVALINGVLMSTPSWGYQTPALASRYRVLLHDCRGQGQSAHPTGPYSMRQHADDLVALMEALGIQRAHIAGISYGGEIAQLLGIHYPERVRSLFLSSTVSEVHHLLRAKIEAWMAAAERRDGAMLYRASVADNFSEPWLVAHPGWAEASIPRYEKLDFDAVLNLCRAFLGIDWTAELHRITAPALVVVGELDTLKPLSPYSRLLVEHIPGAQLLILGNAGHACCIETPAAWNAALLGWLETNHQV